MHNKLKVKTLKFKEHSDYFHSIQNELQYRADLVVG